VQSRSWSQGIEFLHHYGNLGLGLVALGPLPQQPAVALFGLANVPIISIGIAVWLGRSLKYGFFAWAATHAPRLLGRWSKRVEKDGPLE